MQVREYTFRSPYPSQVQIGTPDATTQNNTDQTTQIEDKKTQTNINQSHTRSIIGNEKLTPTVNSLDLYA